MSNNLTHNYPPEDSIIPKGINCKYRLCRTHQSSYNFLHSTTKIDFEKSTPTLHFCCTEKFVRKMIFLLPFLLSTVLASENGGYYTCDEVALADDNQCIFALTGTQPDDWVTPAIPHDVDRTVGADFCRGVQSYAGTMLSVSPKPWVNGDELVGSTSKITGDDWNGYALIFELMAPLRDMMMYDPDALDQDTWDKYTRALTDCNAKTEDYVASRSGGTPYSTSQVYGYLKDPENKDIHHYILQYLEEGTMDLVCLSTDIVMDHCDAIREAAQHVDEHCNCWFDAYKAIYGVCPAVDIAFGECAGTTVATECTGGAIDSEAVDCGGDDETAVVPSGPPEGATGGPPAGGPPARRR